MPAHSKAKRRIRTPEKEDHRPSPRRGVAKDALAKMSFAEWKLSLVVKAIHAILADGRFADSMIAITLRELRKHDAIRAEKQRKDKSGKLRLSALSKQEQPEVAAAAQDQREKMYHEIALTIYDVVRHARALARVAGYDDEWIHNRALCTEDMVEAMLRAYGQENIQERIERACTTLDERESFPDWLVEKFSMQFESRELAECLVMLNTPPRTVLRTNTLRTTRTELARGLARHDVRTVPHGESALIVVNDKNPIATPFFKSGFFEMQDASSQMVSEFLAPKPGERVIDACAGAGGKSLHLAALMENRGVVLALDTDEKKFAQLQKRARRAGAHTIQTRGITSSKTIKRLYESADKVLIDAPCSGTGVLRRNPDAKWRLQPADVEKFCSVQREILMRYPRMAKVGGTVVYAVCSILPEEGEKQVEEFLKQFPSFHLLEERMLMPHTSGFDGFYMAKLRRMAE